jgi:hypothetical protein
MRSIKLLLFLALLVHLCGCALTKVATVPLKVSGAVISVVPVVGSAGDKLLGTTADIIDR